MAAFRHRTKVMFQHCDPAAIVFYPRYFEMINEVVETFFDEAVGWSFREMHKDDGVGVPMARLEASFPAASRLGDVLDWTLKIARIGGASFDLEICASCNGEQRVRAEGTLVLVDLAKMKSIRWSDARRATLATYQKE